MMIDGSDLTDLLLALDSAVGSLRSGDKIDDAVARDDAVVLEELRDLLS